MSKKQIIGNKNIFAIEYEFFSDSKETELSLFVNGNNILAFERDFKEFTTRWNLDDLVIWLQSFLENLNEDPFPFECEGEYAAQKDDAARDFDCEDDDVFEDYYQKLYEWNTRHRWHSVSGGAILADVFFQAVSDNIEISWDNRNPENGIVFKCLFGGQKIAKEVFIEVTSRFLREYAMYWF